MAAQRWDEARPLLVRAGDAALRMGVGADAATIYSTLCLLERQRGDPAAALDAARLGQARCGEVPGLLWDECECLRELGEFPARLNRLNRLAVMLQPEPVILVTLGLALINAHRWRRRRSGRCVQRLHEVIATRRLPLRSPASKSRRGNRRGGSTIAHGAGRGCGQSRCARRAVAIAALTMPLGRGEREGGRHARAA